MSHLISAKPLKSGVKAADQGKFYLATEGSDREVFTSDQFPGLVMKKAIDSTCHWAQIQEVKTWTNMVNDGLGHMVPAHDVVYDDENIILIVEYIEFDNSNGLVADSCYELSIVEQYTADATPGTNCGFTTDGRFILRDGGVVPLGDNCDDFEEFFEMDMAF